jgi:hypothetical protein
LVVFGEGSPLGKHRNRYRPERHYMRGPGPKWHERHGASPAPAATERQDLPFSLWILPVTLVALLGAVVVAALA